MEKPKKLMRSRKDKMLAGVCGGIAEYSNMDPTIIRLIVAVLVIFTGLFPGLIAYVVAMLIIPEEPEAK